METKMKTIGVLLTISSILVFYGMLFGGMGPSFTIVHQILIAFGGSLVVAVYLVAFKWIWHQPLLRVMLTAGVIVLVFQATLGQIMVRSDNVEIMRGFHFAFSVLALGFVSGSAGNIWLLGVKSGGEVGLTWDRFSSWAVYVVLAAYEALISGVFLAESGIQTTCDDWPVCLSLWPPSGVEWIPIIHRAIVGLVAIYLFKFTSYAWRAKRSEKLVLTLATSLTILYFGQAFIGALLSIRGNVDGIGILHGVTSAMIVVTGGLLVVSSLMHNEQTSPMPSFSPIAWNRSQRLKDFIALNKPVVVLLLLATTLGGMVMGYKGFPSLRIVMVTLISGALAAGGSGAVNQYIDKDLDQTMTRTSNRPIPAGRLTPAEGLAYGAGALLISFFLMAGLVNMLSAILTLIGMVYYVFLYSIVLKKRSVQNIVIGGGAGAIPPLVGWAAATGTLNLTAGFLFLIIFLWTPPHFWALALTRKKEYATAGVPMMPVERGDAVTERLILIYTLILVGSTILMWALGLAGWLFLASAIILGTYLIFLGWQVFRNGRNKVYYRMYRHSNYYLLLLFLFLALDSVLI